MAAQILTINTPVDLACGITEVHTFTKKRFLQDVRYHTIETVSDFQFSFTLNLYDILLSMLRGGQCE